MTNIKLYERTLTIVEPDDSDLEFVAVILLHENVKRTFIGWIKSLFSKTITVAVPLELADSYQAGMQKMNGQPLWQYKRVGDQIFNLRPMASICY